MRRLALVLTALPLVAQGTRAVEAPSLAQGEALLARVDLLRHPWPSFTVDLDLQAGRQDQRWRVSTRENGDVRLEGLSDKEKGRAVLMRGEDMWLLLPGTRRPIRVTPQQRLLGPAAGGDVARTRFHEDYRVVGIASDTLDGKACWRLELAAKRPALSARSVRLWVARDGEAPIQAEFRLASGKLARTARFAAPGQAAGRPVLTEMTLLEASGATATLRFSHWRPGGVDPDLFELPGGAP